MLEVPIKQMNIMLQVPYLTAVHARPHEVNEGEGSLFSKPKLIK